MTYLFKTSWSFKLSTWSFENERTPRAWCGPGPSPAIPFKTCKHTHTRLLRAKTPTGPALRYSRVSGHEYTSQPYVRLRRRVASPHHRPVVHCDARALVHPPNLQTVPHLGSTPKDSVRG